MNVTINQTSENLEKKKRFDVVLGIILAAVLGFLLNLAANLYYDLFVIKAVVWKDVNLDQVIWIILLIFGVIGFLQFFIQDYKNDFEMNVSFWKRFFNFFFNDFLLIRALRIIAGVYIIIIFIGFLIILFVWIGNTFNYWLASFSFVVAVLFNFKKNILDFLVKVTESIKSWFSKK